MNANQGRNVFAPCSCGFHDMEAIRARFPLLIRAMQWAAILSESEAICAIRDFKHGGPSGEAVTNFGGPRRVIESAIRWRRAVRAIEKLRNLPRRSANHEKNILSIRPAADDRAMYHRPNRSIAPGTKQSKSAG